MGMGGLKLTFSGKNSHEPLELGEHITVRPTKYYYSPRVFEGQRVLIVNEHEVAGGYISRVLFDVPEKHILAIDDWRLERSHLRDPQKLLEALYEYYPRYMGQWTVIQFETTMRRLDEPINYDN